jgi:hypothetical protein
MAILVDIKIGRRWKTVRIGIPGGSSDYYEEQGIETVSSLEYMTKYLHIPKEIAEAILDQRFVEYKGSKLFNYVLTESGDVVSLIGMKKTMYDEEWRYQIGSLTKYKVIKPHISGKSDYPAVNLSVNGKSTRIAVHRLVCENFHELPSKYPGITVKDWKKTPVSVRKELMKNLQVNHKDGDRTNYHPSNLEWTTGKQNRDHYHQVLRGKRM